MPSPDRNRQPDLFARADAPQPITMEEPPPADWVERIRNELRALLAKVEQATEFPFPNLTAATLAELRFKGILFWLPEEEGTELHTRFKAEMHRLYVAIGEA